LLAFRRGRWRFGRRAVPFLVVVVTLTGTLAFTERASQAGPLAPFYGLVSVSPGSSHTLALGSDGKVYGWGDAAYGQIGSTTRSATPKLVSGISGAKQVAAAFDSSFAVKTDGSVWSWGSNWTGMLGTEATTGGSSATPKKISALAAVVVKAVSTAPFGEAIYALAENGDVWAWGSNLDAEQCLPRAVLKERVAPSKILGLPGPVRSVVAGESSVLFVMLDGSLLFCGDNQFRVVAADPSQDVSAPTPVLGLSDVVAATSGYPTALLGNGSVYIWGSQYGATLPMTLVALPPITAISQASGTATFARRSTGETYAWGYNGGSFGDGSTASSASPVRVPAIDAMSLPVGGNHKGAVASDGRLLMWGSSNSGQLGTGSFVHTTNTATPVVAPQPDAPTVGTLAAQPRNGGALVSWTRPPSTGVPILSNIVEVSDGRTVTFTGDVTSGLVNGLVNGQTYTFRVRAVNGAGEGGWSVATNAITPGTAPAAPLNVQVGEIQPAPIGYLDKKSTEVKWSLATTDGYNPVTGYTVRWTSSAGSGNATACATCTALDIDELFTAGLTYTFTVTARNAVGEGPTSTPGVVTMSGMAPAPPRNLTVAYQRNGTAIDSVRAVMSWTAPESTGTAPLSLYRISVHDANHSPVLFSECAGCLSFTVSNLGLDKGYIFKVQSVTTFSEGGIICLPEITPVSAVTLTKNPTNTTAPTSNCGGGGGGASASTSWFNRQGAISAADGNWDSSWTMWWGAPHDPPFGNDCTNFVSNVWYFGGGLNMTKNFFMKVYTDQNTYNNDAAMASEDVYLDAANLRYYTTNWTVADVFPAYMTDRRKITSILAADPASKFNVASPGDVINWDLGHGRWNHNMVAIGSDDQGDFSTQHTIDRKHSQWNLKWEMDPTMRPHLRARVIHVNVGEQNVVEPDRDYQY
jgi:alpha-tubulin suppressor-like RCC1 family protein